MADRITAEQEAALRAAEAKATPGPWMGPRVTDHFPPGCWGVYLADDEGRPLPGEIVIATGYDEDCVDDARFIALARNAMPALLAELAALRGENERLKKAARHAYYAMPMCFDCWNNEKPKRFVAGRHLHFRLSGDGPPLTWPVDGAARVFGYCDKHKPAPRDGFVAFTERHQVEAIVELEALGMPEVTG